MDTIENDLAKLAEGPKGSPVFFVETDREGKFIYGAGEFAFALDYEVAHLPKNLFKLVSNHSQSLLRGLWDGVLEGRAMHRNEFAFIAASETSRSFGLSLFPVFDKQLAVTSIRLVLSKLDVQKELSIALESAEERFSTIFQASSDPIMILSLEGQLLSANPAFESMVGARVASFFREEHTLIDFFSPEQGTLFNSLLNAARTSGNNQQSEVTMTVADGTERWFDLRVHALRDRAEKMKGLLCIARDVHGYKEMVHTLRQEAEANARRHQQAQNLIGRLKEFLSNIHNLPKDALPFVQGLGSILSKLYPTSLFLIHVDDAVQQNLTGNPPSTREENDLHLLNSTMHRMVSAAESPLYCNNLRTTDPYQTDPLVRYLELKSFIGAPMRDFDGSLLGTILLMDNAEARYDSEDVEVVTVAALMAAGRLRSDADAADKRELEAHLRHSQKMQAVGKLAGGIAHDFNNILSGILGFSSYLLRNAEAGTDLHRDLSMIMKSAERASDLTRQLLSFSRKRHFEKKPVNVNDILREVESVITHSVANNLKVTTEIDDNIGPILADDGQIHQVIMNLCINAADAMNRRKGEIILRSEERRLTEKETQLVENPDDLADTYVVVQIQDTGPGIPENIREHLFEPFFTTKPDDEGTGLGLSIVYGIATNHGGGIKVDSELGVGSTFSVFLPVCHDR